MHLPACAELFFKHGNKLFISQDFGYLVSNPPFSQTCVVHPPPSGASAGRMMPWAWRGDKVNTSKQRVSTGMMMLRADVFMKVKYVISNSILK
jgi:hypothetical protein